MKAKQGLVSPEQREFFAQNARSNPQHLTRFAEIGREMLTEIPPEERAREAASRRHSAQERLEAEKSGRYVASRERANRRVVELKGREATPEDTELPVVASGEDAPYYRPDKPRTQWGAHIRQVRRGLVLVERSCTVCGSRYLTPKSRPRKTCSDECKTEMRRAQAARMNERRSKR